MSSQPCVEVIIPALNEEGTIEAVVLNLLAQGASRVIVADNGSTDRTAYLAEQAGATVVHEPRHGYGRACLAGMTALRDAEIVVFADADGCDDPRDLPHLLAPLFAQRAECCIGSRCAGSREPGALPCHSRCGNWLAALGMRVCFGQHVTDMGPFRAIRRDALERLHMAEPNFGWNVEMQAKSALAGLRVVEVPVSYRKRVSGQSKITGNLLKSLQAGTVILGSIMKYRFLGQRALRQPKLLTRHSRNVNGGGRR